MEKGSSQGVESVAAQFARDLISTNTGRYQHEEDDGTIVPGDYSCIICDARGPTETLEHKPDCVVGRAAAYLAAHLLRCDVKEVNDG